MRRRLEASYDRAVGRPKDAYARKSKTQSVQRELRDWIEGQAEREKVDYKNPRRLLFKTRAAALKYAREHGAKQFSIKKLKRGK